MHTQADTTEVCVHAPMCVYKHTNIILHKICYTYCSATWFGLVFHLKTYLGHLFMSVHVGHSFLFNDYIVCLCINVS